MPEEAAWVGELALLGDSDRGVRKAALARLLERCELALARPGGQEPSSHASLKASPPRPRTPCFPRLQSLRCVFGRPSA